MRPRVVVLDDEPTLYAGPHDDDLLQLPPVAELAWEPTMSTCPPLRVAIPRNDARLHAGTWSFTQGTELAGKTLGVLGPGAIGQYMARLAHRLGMRVMKPSAVFINTARGALVEAPRQRRIAAAGLGVFAHEPLEAENNLFMDLDNVVLMPHAGAITREAIARVRKMPIASILGFLAGQPEHVVTT